MVVEVSGLSDEQFLSFVQASREDTSTAPFHEFSKKALALTDDVIVVATSGMRLRPTRLPDGDLRMDPIL